MTNDKFQMTKEIRNPNDKGNGRRPPCWDFVFCHSFDIGHLSFVIVQSLLTSGRYKFMNDLKFAFRDLLRNSGFAAVVALTVALGNEVRVLDCGGKRSATPLSHAKARGQRGRFLWAPRIPKAVSPLRSATAVQDAAAPPDACQPLTTDHGQRTTDNEP